MRHQQVDAWLVGNWVVGTVEEWLPGFADDEAGRQYRIRQVGERVFEVEPARGPGMTRRFQVTVSVAEVPT